MKLSRPSRSSLALLGLLALVLLACSLQSRTRTSLVPPPGMTLEPAHIHLSVATGKPPSPIPPPSPGTDVHPHEATVDGTSMTIEADVRCNLCFIQLTVWHDTNHNKKVDSGDATGSLGAAVEGKDVGYLGRTYTDTPPIYLSAVP